MMPPLPREMQTRRMPYDQLYARSEIGRPLRENYESLPMISLYQKMAWVYAGIFAIANSIARIPFNVYRDIDGTATPVEANHPLAALLWKPDRQTSAYRLKEHTVAFLELVGDAYWLLDGGRAAKGGPPAAIVPLPSHLVTPIPDVDARVGGYELAGANGQGKVLASEEVVHFNYFSPVKKITGQGSLEAAQMAALTDLYIQTFNKNFFRNGGMLGGVLQTDEEIDSRTMEAMTERFVEKMRGQNAWRWAGLTHGVKATPMTPTHTEMLFPELRRMNREEILGCLNVPPVMVGILDGASYANARQQKQEFYQNNVLPKLEMILSTLNMSLATRYGEDVYIAADLTNINALREDMVALATVIQGMLDRGAVTRNEARAWLMTGEIPALRPLTPAIGDTVFLPFNLVPAGEVQEDEPVDMPAGGDDADPVEEMLRSLEGAVGEYARTRQAEMVRLAMWRRFDREAARFGRVFERQSKAMFAVQLDAALKRLAEEAAAGKMVGSVVSAEKAGLDAIRLSHSADSVATLFLIGPAVKGIQDVAAVIDVDLAKWSSTMKAVYAETILAAGNGALAAIETDTAFSMLAPGVKDFLDREGAQLVTEVNATTKTRLGQSLAEGVANGENISQLGDRVRAILGEDASRLRATTIGRTESIKGYNFGNVEGYRQVADLLEGKEWLSSRDDRVRDSHADADGQVVGLNAPFSVGDQLLDYPGAPGADPSETVNCRCTVLPVLREGASFRSQWIRTELDAARRNGKEIACLS